ncbi:ribosome maturation factor RimM [Argonema antarcticum]|uniref:ribosome maturation factor RimM n=1 Tax=Argonema antarcticum TaxID=2942763 RepID=UPI002012BA72|nr:ribosome maturation factor RimM [Argonema antarcticum]MCL1471069.1 ribosome maturation factor RimM [Argonema antarcticum A004/B2]
MNNSEWLEIGEIVSAQGLNGEVRVYPDSDFPERFEKPGKRWLLRSGQTEPQPIELLSGRYIPHKGIYVIKLAGVNDRTQAEALQGGKLMVPESDRPHLEEDEFHVIDLIGLEVFNQLTGESIGIVVDVASAGNDLLIVNPHSSTTNKPGENTKEKQILIPFVKAIVPVVNLENGKIEITPPPGLLEI